MNVMNSEKPDNSDKGTPLEQLVKRIEALLLPTGLTIKSNDKVFNDDGVQIAEFDIRIVGRAGSISVDWLIECRDRPSEGSAPGGWIEQLVGRRSLFKFDKVIAVSTTGFSPGAIKLAHAGGIVLRTVDEVSDIPDQIHVQRMRYRITHMKSLGVPQVSFPAGKYPELLRLPLTGDVSIRLPPDAAPVNLTDLMVGFLNGHEEVFNSRNGEVKTFVIGFENRPAILEFRGEKKFDVFGFRIPVTVEVEVIEGEIPGLVVYSEEGDSIGIEGEYTFRTSLGEVKQVFRCAYGEGGRQVVHLPPPSYPKGKFAGIRCFQFS